MFFIFKQKTAYEMRISDWSSDVCSSDLRQVGVMQHIQQLDEERHFLHRTAFHQGQDKLTRLQADKKIGVFADRQSVVSGKSVSVRVDIGGRRIINHKHHINFKDDRTTMTATVLY